jgi:hypothetical protein
MRRGECCLGTASAAAEDWWMEVGMEYSGSSLGSMLAPFSVVLSRRGEEPLGRRGWDAT